MPYVPGPSRRQEHQLTAWERQVQRQRTQFDGLSLNVLAPSFVRSPTDCSRDDNVEEPAFPVPTHDGIYQPDYCPQWAWTSNTYDEMPTTASPVDTASSRNSRNCFTKYLNPIDFIVPSKGCSEQSRSYQILMKLQQQQKDQIASTHRVPTVKPSKPVKEKTAKISKPKPKPPTKKRPRDPHDKLPPMPPKSPKRPLERKEKVRRALNYSEVQHINKTNTSLARFLGELDGNGQEKPRYSWMKVDRDDSFLNVPRFVNPSQDPAIENIDARSRKKMELFSQGYYEPLPGIEDKRWNIFSIGNLGGGLSDLRRIGITADFIRGIINRTAGVKLAELKKQSVKNLLMAVGNIRKHFSLDIFDPGKMWWEWLPKDGTDPLDLACIDWSEYIPQAGDADEIMKEGNEASDADLEQDGTPEPGIMFTENTLLSTSDGSESDNLFKTLEADSDYEDHGISKPITENLGKDFSDEGNVLSELFGNDSDNEDHTICKPITGNLAKDSKEEGTILFELFGRNAHDEEDSDDSGDSDDY